MDMTSKRAELLASMQFPAAVAPAFDEASIRVEQLRPVEMREGKPFFGGYMMDDMLEDMGVSQTDEGVERSALEDLL